MPLSTFFNGYSKIFQHNEIMRFPAVCTRHKVSPWHKVKQYWKKFLGLKRPCDTYVKYPEAYYISCIEHVWVGYSIPQKISRIKGLVPWYFFLYISTYFWLRFKSVPKISNISPLVSYYLWSFIMSTWNESLADVHFLLSRSTAQWC